MRNFFLSRFEIDAPLSDFSSDPMLNPWRVADSHEDLFVQRYNRLVGMSLQLTGHDREQAEDLVHEAFVEFTLSRPDLDSIQNLEGYLYGMLRNLYLSQVRRAARRHTQSLSLLDYDSAEIGRGRPTHAIGSELRMSFATSAATRACVRRHRRRAACSCSGSFMVTTRSR